GRRWVRMERQREQRAAHARAGEVSTELVLEALVLSPDAMDDEEVIDWATARRPVEVDRDPVVRGNAEGRRTLERQFLLLDPTRFVDGFPRAWPHGRRPLVEPLGVAENQGTQAELLGQGCNGRRHGGGRRHQADPVVVRERATESPHRPVQPQRPGPNPRSPERAEGAEGYRDHHCSCPVTVPLHPVYTPTPDAT